MLLQPFYDVVERVVAFRLPFGNLLAPGLLYHVELVTPLDNETGDCPSGPRCFGFAAFDGAPLSRTNAVPLKFSFVTARETPSAAPAAAPPTCFEAWSAFARSGCSSGGCHSGSDAPMGLRLDSREGLVDTAVAHVAHEADTGPVSGEPLIDPLRFGTEMPIIDPGAPATSYLLYKLLVGPRNFGTCDTKYRVAMPSGVCPAPPAAERQRLLDWFVRLEPMPPGGELDGGTATLNLLQAFIAAGAETDTCP